MTIFCATTNRGKLVEFRLAIDHFAGGRIRLEPVPGLREMPPAPEHGETFEENAVQKAVYYGSRVPGWIFADDSGLVVDALGGEPGVRSARYSGPGATDASNNALLLEKLKGAEGPSARFVCAVALVHDGRLVRTFHGAVEGRILRSPRGSGGFGYDPLFFYPPLSRTLAEATEQEKLSVSHRGRALREMVAWLLAPGEETLPQI